MKTTFGVPPENLAKMLAVALEPIDDDDEVAAENELARCEADRKLAQAITGEHYD